MKLSFFTLALLGFVQQAQAVNLDSGSELTYRHDAEFDMESLGQTDVDGASDTTVHGEGESEGRTQAEADCYQNINGVLVRLNTPECIEVPKVTFEQQMLLALQELTGKSQDLYEALRLQFAKNAKLSAAKTMTVSGSLSFKPKIDDTPIAPIVPAAPPKDCPCNHGLVITGTPTCNTCSTK
jgi:hypothetical protein